jgi:hypothetical protein
VYIFVKSDPIKKFFNERAGVGTFRPDRINAVADRFGVIGKEAQE